MERLTLDLVGDGLDDLRVPMSDVEDAEAAEAIDIFLAVDVAVGVRA